MSAERLSELRREIDDADRILIQTLAKRMSLVKQVAEYKKENNMPPLQPGRWQEVLRQVILMGEELGLTEQFITTMWNQIHDEALDIEAKHISFLWNKD